MQDRMSAEEYQRTIVKPALGEDVFIDELSGVTPTIRGKGFAVDREKHKNILNPTEHEIQNAILDRLKLVHRGFFWRENSGMMVAEHNGKKRMFRAGITGIADIMGVFRGFPVAIEVKRPGKKPSHEQLAFKQRFEECGGIYIVCSDPALVMGQINSAIKVLEEK